MQLSILHLAPASPGKTPTSSNNGLWYKNCDSPTLIKEMEGAIPACVTVYRCPDWLVWAGMSAWLPAGSELVSYRAHRGDRAQGPWAGRFQAEPEPWIQHICVVICCPLLITRFCLLWSVNLKWAPDVLRDLGFLCPFLFVSVSLCVHGGNH